MGFEFRENLKKTLTGITNAGYFATATRRNFKMRFTSYIISLATAGSAFGASAVLIDDFDTNGGPGFALFTPTTASDGPDVVPGSDTSLVSTVTRNVSATTQTGSGITAAHNLTGKLTFATDSGNTGLVGLTYDIAPAADLTVGGGNAFSLVLVSTDLSASVNYTIKITDTALNTSTKTAALPVVLGVFNVLFSEFSGVNFSAVSKVELSLLSLTAGSDVDVDAFGINLPPPPNVPEASTYAAAGFMAAAALGVYRRSRN